MTDTGLPKRTLGNTGLQVTTLGYGAMSLDDRFGRTVTVDEARTVLNAVLDAGINLIDTSPDYGPSEEFIGESIAHRRDEYVLATKVGCPVDIDRGQQGHVYTRRNVIAAVEQSLRRMRTDHLDIVQFHGSPSRAALEEDGVLQALEDLRRDGKIRFVGMSGTLPNIEDHLQMGVFEEYQIPYSIVQREHEAAISEAARQGAGTLIRGGVARGGPSEEKAWDVRRLPEVPQERPRQTWEQAGLDVLLDGMNRMEFTLRFTLSHPDVHTTIVGTANLDHLRANCEVARKGVLPADVVAEAKRRLDAAGG
ncbi:MAG: aldo/keto reductase [Chloroflexi bacterium]|nr:aldo/keto reductase [Chloroflexota bacterium]MDA1240668.1 aldo/keto reductase [Chloroflexota bacterium]